MQWRGGAWVGEHGARGGEGQVGEPGASWPGNNGRHVVRIVTSGIFQFLLFIIKMPRVLGGENGACPGGCISFMLIMLNIFFDFLMMFHVPRPHGTIGL